MVAGLMPKGYSTRHEASPDALDPDRRWWWCPDCGSVYGRHHSETERKFCYECDARDAVHIEMEPVGKGADAFLVGGDA